MGRNIFFLPCMKVVLCCILSHVQHTTHCHVFKVIYLSHAMWQCVTPQALVSSTACSRLSDRRKTRKTKHFRVCAFSIQRTRLSRSLEQAISYIYLYRRGTWGFTVLRYYIGLFSCSITVILILTCGIAVSSSFCGMRFFIILADGIRWNKIVHSITVPFICVFLSMQYAKQNTAGHKGQCALGLRCIVDVEFSRWRRRSRNFPGYMLYISIDIVLFWESYPQLHKLILI